MTLKDEISMMNEDGIDLSVLWRIFWRNRLLVAIAMILGAAIAAYVALTAIPVYRAEATVTSVSEEGASAAMSLSNQFGGLASLAGINLGDSDKSQIAVATLRSRHLVEEFIRRNGLLDVLYPKAEKPTLWRAVQRFRKNVVSFREDKRAGTYTVTIDWRDPKLAAQWANSMVALANEVLRSRAIEDSKRNVDYLNAQLTKTDVVEVRSVMYNIIESETKTLMFANARAEYAFAVVDPAVAPETRISPKRTVMVFSGLLIGLVVGYLVGIVRDRIVAGKRANVPPASFTRS